MSLLQVTVVISYRTTELKNKRNMFLDSCNIQLLKLDKTISRFQKQEILARVAATP